MNHATQPRAYAELVEPATLQIERLLPGPMERVWAYLTDSTLRRQWLAAGEMQPEVGSSVELVWRNDELTTPPGHRPAGYSEEHRMRCTVLECSAPHRLAITWGEASEVLFELQAHAEGVQLRITHRRPPNREVLLNVSAGWHAHLDVLVAKLTGATPAPHWDHFVRLRADYDGRHPA